MQDQNESIHACGVLLLQVHSIFCVVGSCCLTPFCFFATVKELVNYFVYLLDLF
nr:MAG TPA: hypothetical protein [Caudoviricetes sp.]